MTVTTAIDLLTSVLLPSGIGYALLTIMFRRDPLSMPLKLSLGFGLGAGILSHWMLILGVMGIPFNLTWITIPLTIILSLMCGLLLIRRKLFLSSSANIPLLISTPSKNAEMFPRFFCAIAVFYIIYIFIFIFWHSLNIPISTWDPIATSAFKAKIFFYDRSIHQLRLPHASYPLHVPLMQAWTALNLNEWDDLLLKIIFPLTFVAYAIIHYTYLKIHTTKEWAIAGLCLLFSSNFLIYHTTTAYRDTTMLYYNCTTIILLLLWDKTRNIRFLLLSSFFAGLTTFVKLEGTEYLLVYTILLVIILCRHKYPSLREKAAYFLKFTIPSYSICLFYYLCKLHFQITSAEGRIAFVFSARQLTRLPEILKSFGTILFMEGNWNILWLFLATSILCNFRKMKNCAQIQLLAGALITFLGVYIAFLTFTSAVIHYPTTLSRVILHFFPICPLMIILLNYPRANT